MFFTSLPMYKISWVSWWRSIDYFSSRSADKITPQKLICCMIEMQCPKTTVQSLVLEIAVLLKLRYSKQSFSRTWVCLSVLTQFKWCFFHMSIKIDCRLHPWFESSERLTEQRVQSKWKNTLLTQCTCVMKQSFFHSHKEIIDQFKTSAIMMFLRSSSRTTRKVMRECFWFTFFQCTNILLTGVMTSKFCWLPSFSSQNMCVDPVVCYKSFDESKYNHLCHWFSRRKW